MKNIHVLPTDKPSNLIHNVLGYGIINDEFTKSDLELIQAEFQNIYITSNKGIKEGNWCLELQTGKIFRAGLSVGTDYEDLFKKIILTDNKDLIKDGVQPIDDEFLEWFVNNSSCEEVEIEEICPLTCCIQKEGKTKMNNGCMERNRCLNYKIIIPKEEPKQEEINFIIKELNEERKRVTKQETLEEVAKDFIENTMKYSFNSLETKTFANRLLKSVEFGAKWQAERMYSEEEVLDLLHRRSFHLTHKKDTKTTKEWFEQFKKK